MSRRCCSWGLGAACRVKITYIQTGCSTSVGWAGILSSHYGQFQCIIEGHSDGYFSFVIGSWIEIEPVLERTGSGGPGKNNTFLCRGVCRCLNHHAPGRTRVNVETKMTVYFRLGVHFCRTFSNSKSFTRRTHTPK